jgi:hypothetical protein
MNSNVSIVPNFPIWQNSKQQQLLYSIPPLLMGLKNGLVTSLEAVLAALIDGLEACLRTSGQGGQPVGVGKQQQLLYSIPPLLVGLKNGLVTSLKIVLAALMDGLEACLGTSRQPVDVGKQHHHLWA